MKNRICLITVLLGALLLCACQRREEAVLAELPATGEYADKTGYAGAAEEDIPAGCDAETSCIETITVHVCGAVEAPGVYELLQGSRGIDAVNAAGGMTAEADADYLNLAAPLADGQQLFVPTKEEAGELRKQDEAAVGGKININTASKELLTTLPGIGTAKAESIIAYRTEHGPFSSIEELMEISGIKEAVFSKIKDFITVD